MTTRNPMQPKLPDAYLEQMTRQLGPVEAEAFLNSYAAARTYGLRLNTAKLTADDPRFEAIRDAFGLEPVPWCPTGYAYPEQARPGKHPYHAAGAYYIQEPSAMSAAELLAPRPGELVLDLAAAPGGKATHIADKLAGTGLLVANEIHPGRAAILSENIERMGITNAIVVSAAPDALIRRFGAIFDAVMLDAPCSGEGMFRKDPDAVREWSPEQVEACAARQEDVLSRAADLVKPGGRLVYSTCTFNERENEGVLANFLAARPDWELVRTERYWPHRTLGEGHFAALLRKRDEAGSESVRRKSGRRRPDKAAADAWKQAEAMLREIAPGLALPAGEPLLFGDRLFWMPSLPDRPLPEGWADGLKVPRPGLHVADVRKNRLEPAHALAMALTAERARAANYASGSPEADAYLRGETIAPTEGLAPGWCLVAVDGLPLGWGKCTGDTVKNHLPKGLRRPAG
ncbi:RsmB/NOP family class I SAM-dependent RNA methyltransferase [Paenibacillus thermoaerophilus]|uniref:RsmB/NOP family class I SAM-dependent RNA methyltransferase n=1 Tax=Paenibacillus thermoaerophilus TaxID=1215385 RepID=A0ABW2V5H3_9BACL